MGWPEYTMLALYAMGLGVALAKDGEPKEGRYSFWTSLLASALGVWLLYMGEFFA